MWVSTSNNVWPTSMLAIGSVATHSCAIGADLLVLLLTWAKTYSIRRVALQLRVRATLSNLLLRDGGLHFMTLPEYSLTIILGTAYFLYAHYEAEYAVEIYTMTVQHPPRSERCLPDCSEKQCSMFPRELHAHSLIRYRSSIPFRCL